MDLTRIRNMSDKELENYLKSLSNKKLSICSKCGKTNTPYTITVSNRKKAQTRKLCSMCTECYTKLLEDLELNDVIWD